MATELYDLSVPALLRGLRNLSDILAKARAWADEQGLDHRELLEARLIDDMHPLTSQIQRVSDTAKGVAARIGDIEVPAMPDEEQSFDDLQSRLARTIEVLETVRPEQMNGREDKAVQLNFPNGSFDFTGRDYVLGFALPNFYFHVTTAYAILRMKGAPLGKLDYIKSNP